MRDAESDGGKNTRKKFKDGNLIIGHFCDFWSFLGGIWGKSIFMKKGNCWAGCAQRWQKKGWRLEAGGRKDLPQRTQRIKVGGGQWAVPSSFILPSPLTPRPSPLPTRRVAIGGVGLIGSLRVGGRGVAAGAAA